MADRADAIARAYLDQHAAGARYVNLTGALAPRDAADAYAAQARFQALAGDAGRGPLGGRKIALASKVQQQLCNIDHPIAGGVFAREIHRSPAQIRHADYHGLGVEFEMATEIGADITADSAPFTRDSVRRHIRAIHPAFELIIDRDADYSDLNALSMIADNAWCGGVVLGDEVPDWRARDLNDIAASLSWNNEPPQPAVTGDADPLGSLVWIAEHIAGQGGAIRAGEIVITGSVIKTRKPQPGDRIRYAFDGLAAVEMAVV